MKQRKSNWDVLPFLAAYNRRVVVVVVVVVGSGCGGIGVTVVNYHFPAAITVSQRTFIIPIPRCWWLNIP